MTEDVKIWQEIKVIIQYIGTAIVIKIYLILLQAAVSTIYRAGINPIEVLLWSRGRRLKEVQDKLEEIKNKESKEETKSTTFNQ